MDGQNVTVQCRRKLGFEASQMDDGVKLLKAAHFHPHPRKPRLRSPQPNPSPAPCHRWRSLQEAPEQSRLENSTASNLFLPRPPCLHIYIRPWVCTHKRTKQDTRKTKESGRGLETKRIPLSLPAVGEKVAMDLVRHISVHTREPLGPP